jgi:quercetin dioxygenase-like cupin family protein
MEILRQDELPFSRISREFVGDAHGDAGVCLILVDAPPGRGPGLHKHPYPEVFLIQEGEGTFRAGDAERAAGAGDLIVVPAETWHGFTATGGGNLKMVTIHPSNSFTTVWKDD